MAEPRTDCLPPCGFGLLGICCSACLHGPCRRSPFEPEPGGRFCGEDRDWIVTRNLVGKVAAESLRAIAALRDRLPPERGEAGGAPPESERLLSPWFRGALPLWERIYPEAAFPLLHGLGFSAGSWMAALLEISGGEREPAATIDGQLQSLLRLSAMTLAAGELTRRLAGLPAAGVDLALPPAPAPLTVLVTGGAAGPRGEGGDAFAGIEAACREQGRYCGRIDASLLPALARAIRERWGIPVSMTGGVAVVHSPSVADGLGALALGFSVAADPAFPIHGSPRVEGYLTRTLGRIAGGGYLPPGGPGDPIRWRAAGEGR